MAGLFFDSFDHYASADLTTKWTQLTGSPTIAAIGRRSGNGLLMDSNSDGVKVTPTSPVPSGATFIAGFAYRHVSAFTGSSSTSENSCDLIMGVRSGGVTQAWLRCNADATMSVLSGTTLLGTTTLALQQNVYCYIELKVLIHPSAGTVDLRVNGASWLSLTGKNTRNAATSTWNEFSVGPPTVSSSSVNVDDVYLLDGSGSSNNDFLGDIRVDVVFPNAAGNSSQWTRSTGSDQWATIDEAAPNGDTDYNETATVTNRDTLNFPNAPVAGADILAIQTVAYGKKTDSGAAGVKLVARLGGTDYDGTEVALGTAYNYVRQVYDVNPATSTPWTDTAFNAAEFGYDKSA